MKGRKIAITVFAVLFTTSLTFGQTEVFKNVVNNLAFYKQKKDLKYLGNAKKSIDSLIKTHADSADLQKNAYKAVVYSWIVYIDTLNKLNLPANSFDQTCKLVNKISTNRKIYKFQPEIDFAKSCLANVYLKKAFVHIRNYDYGNAIAILQKAQAFTPSFLEINSYIAYCSNKLGNVKDAAKFYTNLLKTDSTKAEYIQIASNSYKSIGDTVKALQILQKGRRLVPSDRSLILDEANIYSNQNDYRSLAPLLPELLETNPNSADVAFVAANCYDHLNEVDKAELLYLRAADLNSSAYDPAYSLGLLYLKEGIAKKGVDGSKTIAKSEQWLEKANEISPGDVKCLELLQLAYTQTGDENQLNQVKSKIKLLTNP